MQLFKEWRTTIGYYSLFAAAPALLVGVSRDLRAQDITENSLTVPKESDTFRKRGMSFPGPLGTRGQDRRSFEDNILSATPTNGSDDCPGTPIPTGSYTAASPYTDAGDTTGANDTVTRLPYYCYYYGTCLYNDSQGPDRIYSFVVNSIGPNPSITVTTDSSTYRPMIYVIDGCPAGQGNTFFYRIWAINDSRWGSGNTAVIQMPPDLRLGRRYYLFVDSRLAGDAGPYNLTVSDMQINSALPVRANRPDFDGDGKSDTSVFRAGDSTWYVNGSTSGFSATKFGLPTDRIAPEDYDGDGKTDIAVFRDGDWWILRSSDSTPEIIHFGQAGDIPVPADYTGDGRSEIAVFRSGEWWMYDIVNGKTSVARFGQAGDIPVPGDYMGDNRSDAAVFRNGEWWMLDLGTGQYWFFIFGQAGDRPVPGDYYYVDEINPAVYRDGTWYVYIQGNASAFQWGLPTDVPVPGDYDGDGKTDLAVYRDGAWWIRQTRNGQPDVRIFGLSNDTPVPAANVR